MPDPATTITGHMKITGFAMDEDATKCSVRAGLFRCEYSPTGRERHMKKKPRFKEEKRALFLCAHHEKELTAIGLIKEE